MRDLRVNSGFAPRLVGLALALAVFALPGAAHAAIITVNTDGDAGGGCTLRNAIDSADTDSSLSGCTQGSGNDTVQIPAGVVTSPLQLAGGLLIAGGNMGALTVNGPGVTALDLRPQTGSGNRILQVSTANDPVTVSGMTISHAVVTGSSGGGVTVPVGSVLTLDDVVVADNSTTVTTASGGPNATGSGILSSGTLTILDSTITGNSVNATVTGSGSPVAGGGGIFSGGTLTVRDSTVSGNTASATVGVPVGGAFPVADGGGIYQSSNSPVVIEGSTVSGNSVTASAPGQSGIAQGGGVKVNSGGANTLAIRRSTISGNQATGTTLAWGGGIYTIAGTNPGSSILESDTVTGNAATAPDIQGANAYLNRAITRNTIVTDPLGAGANCLDAGQNASGGFNLEGGTDTCGFDLPTDQVSVVATGLDPALTQNGGSTLTHGLLPGSPAIDQGKNFTLADTFDQRGTGFARTVDFPGLPDVLGGDATDIGAYELQQACAGQATPGASCAEPPVTTPSAAGLTGQRDAAIRKCKKKFRGKAKAKQRKKCIKKAKNLPV